MIIKVPERSVFIFDLDDTLYPEVEFLKSGFRAIERHLYPYIQQEIFAEMLDLYKYKKDVFSCIIEKYKSDISFITKDQLLLIYRNHFPDIKLEKNVHKFLLQIQSFEKPIGLITDGRSLTQRNKLEALGIQQFFTDVIISEEFGTEKPHPNNFYYFEKKYAYHQFYFFADNTSKDFIVPAKRNWNCFCLKASKTNIHYQDLNLLPHSVSVISSYEEVTLENSVVNTNLVG